MVIVSSEAGSLFDSWRLREGSVRSADGRRIMTVESYLLEPGTDGVEGLSERSEVVDEGGWVFANPKIGCGATVCGTSRTSSKQATSQSVRVESRG